MNLSARTQQSFASNLAAIRRNPTYDGRRPAALASQRKQHAAYRNRFSVAVASITAMDDRTRERALAVLLKLGGLGCRSGTMEFSGATDFLARMGLAEANYLFESDRDLICEHFDCARVVAT